jgi:RNA-directed DNA polymerase
MQTAMVFTLQQPTQRQRFGELPEGLSGSTCERGRCGETRQDLGRPAWFLRGEPPGGCAERGAEDHEGVRAAQSTRRRESRAHGEGADRKTQPAQENMARTCRSGPTMPTSLQGIAQKAARQKGYRFRTRYGRLNEDCLQQCWRDIRQEAAAGVEQVSAQAYAQHRDDNIHHLVERLQQQRYRATRGRRQSMPQGDGTQRPLGMPAVEDTRLQLAGARLLEAISEQDFLRCRSGYRPQGGALDAVDTLPLTLQCGRYAWGVAADLTQCFDTIDQDWMVRIFAERLEEGARLRLLRTWRKAGVLDPDGQGLHPVTGTPHGGTVSPGLANVCLPYVRDIGVAKVVKRPGRGEAWLMRYADDCGGACADQADAARFDNVLGRRREQGGLELSGAKTRRIPCSRDRQAGKMRVEFLGFEVRWGKDRKGPDPLKRRTARQQLRSALQRFTAWCKEPRHLRLPVLVQRLNAQLRGSSNDDGVHGNAASLQEFFNKAIRIL